MPTGRRLPRMCVFAAFAFCIASQPVFAQTTSASVSGVVEDAQGAVLQGALVTLTSETQGTSQTAVTDSQGRFLIPFVRPGTYALRISLEGFQNVDVTSLVVNANDRISIGDTTLAIGQRQETVRVTARPSDIQLSGGERGFAVQSTALEAVGISGRSVFALVPMVPGVVPNSSSFPTGVSAFNINGQRANSNNMTIDGVGNIDTGDNGGNMVQTNLDAIAEVKVLTSSYQAEYGRSAGGQVQVVTKSGGRDFRGAGYWYGRRSRWNENTWLNERDGTPIEKSSRNDQGYTIGGPLFVPGAFNTGRNKLFFFWNQEFQRRKDPVPEKRVTVPTELERNGDFSQSLDASGNPYPYIRNSTLNLPCNSANTAGCFRYQGVLGRIDPSRLYAPTLAALRIFPLPNVTGQKLYNYKSQEPSYQPLDQSLLRLDYQASANWRVAGRYMWHQNKSEYPYGFGSLASVPTANGIWDWPGYNWQVSTTGVLSSTVALEILVGSAHNEIAGDMRDERLTRSAAGMSALPMLFPTAVQNDRIPTFSFAGGRVANAAAFNTMLSPFSNFNTTYDVVANLTKTVGGHSVKVGAYLQRSLKDQTSSGAFNGTFVFTDVALNPSDSGYPYANAALGVYAQFQQQSARLVPQWRYWNVEWYGQDTWRPTSRLTADFGVRFYYLTPQWDVSRQASTWLPDRYDAAKAVRLFAPAVVNGVRVAYDAATRTSVSAAFIGRVVPGSGDPFNGAFRAGQGVSDSMTDGSKFRVSPRVGFALDLTGRQRLVARGGFAVLYDRPQGNEVFDQINNAPGLQTQTLMWGLVRDIQAATPNNPTVAMYPSAYKWTVPTVYQWNLGLQALLPGQVTLDVAYVGSRSEHLLQQRNLNPVPYGAAFLPQNQDPTRGRSCAGCQAMSLAPGGNALPADFMRPYPGYGNIRLWEFESYARYHALQVAIARRLSHGVMFGAHYTWSSAKGTIGTDWETARIDGRDREANYGPLSFARPHVFVASFVYRVPDAAGGALGLLANGWQLSGNYRWLHGNPYTATFAFNDGTANVNLTGSSTESARIALTGQATGSGWSRDPYRQFSVSAFTAPKTNSIGLESSRFTMWLPPYQSLDLSISKSFALGGRRRIEVRLDAFNALNGVNYTGVNSTINFKSLTDSTMTNLPLDANGNLVRPFGAGAVNAVGPARELQLMTRFVF